MGLIVNRMFSKTPRVLVVGDLMIDHYLWGKCERISPEAPVQIVDIEKENTVLGGAGNVISNLLALGAQVGVISIVGDDADGRYISENLVERRVVVECLPKISGRKTSRKSRVMATHQQVVRFDYESKNSIESSTEEILLEAFKNCVEKYEIILLSDYGKGLLTPILTQGIISNALGRKVLIDPKGNDYSKYKGATLLTPNKKEASHAYGKPIEDMETLIDAGWILRQKFELESIIITLSEDGMILFDKQVAHIPTVAREVFDVTGAGDTVLATLGFALTCGLSLKEASLFANSAAAVVVGKLGSATASLDEIKNYDLAIGLKKSTKILTKEALKERLNLSIKNKIVFTNGCFDLLHAGHVQYLQKAKALGEVLIVGLNSDQSVQKLKGPSRPINPEDDRALVLSGLEAVDYIVIFNEETPENLIAYLKPDVLVKGADYAGKPIAGSNHVHEVVLIELLEGRSSSGIIKKVQNGNHD